MLTAIEITSNFAVAIPLKGHKDGVVCTAFEQFLKENKCNGLSTDDGSEFTSKIFKAIIAREGISHYTTDDSDYHAYTTAKIERFHRTLKMMILRYFLANNTQVWVERIQKLVRNYNNSVHTGIGMRKKWTPAKVLKSNKKMALVRLKKIVERAKRMKKIHRYAIGDRVRLMIKKKFLIKNNSVGQKIFTRLQPNTQIHTNWLDEKGEFSTGDCRNTMVQISLLKNNVVMLRRYWTKHDQSVVNGRVIYQPPP